MSIEIRWNFSILCLVLGRLQALTVSYGDRVVLAVVSQTGVVLKEEFLAVLKRKMARAEHSVLYCVLTDVM